MLEPPLPLFIVTISSSPQPSPSLAVSHCPLEQNKSQLPIFDMTGLFWLMKDFKQMSFRSAAHAGNQAGTVIRWN